MHKIIDSCGTSFYWMALSVVELTRHSHVQIMTYTRSVQLFLQKLRPSTISPNLLHLRDTVYTQRVHVFRLHNTESHKVCDALFFFGGVSWRSESIKHWPTLNILFSILMHANSVFMTFEWMGKEHSSRFHRISENKSDLSALVCYTPLSHWH